MCSYNHHNSLLPLLWILNSLELMKKSSISQMNDSEPYYDPQIEFSLFMDEARKHVNDKELKPTPIPTRTVEDRSKRSWKNSLCFWRKSEKKEAKAPGGSSSSNPKIVSNSGPIPRSRARPRGVHRSSAWPGSGPLAGWFTPTRADETEPSYRPLHRRSNPSGAQVFGPIYTVT